MKKQEFSFKKMKREGHVLKHGTLYIWVHGSPGHFASCFLHDTFLSKEYAIKVYKSRVKDMNATNDPGCRDILYIGV